MSDEPNDSPAVASLKKERAEQAGGHAKGDLDRALDDSFPASDPISMTSTSISSGRADTESAERVSTGDDGVASSPDNRDGTRASGDTPVLRGGIGQFVEDHPLAAAGFVAAFSYIWGATR